MSDLNEEQSAVPDTKSEAKPSPEATDQNAQGSESDPYAEALKEWAETPTPQPVLEQGSQPAQYDPDYIDPREFRQLQQSITEKQMREDLSKVIGEVRGEFPSDKFDDLFVESWLDAMARRDKEIIRAWDKRNEDPAKFNRLVKGLSKQFAKSNSKFLGYDEKATEDRELVAHAVRGGSKPAPEERMPELGSLPDGEYRQYIRKKFGFDPGV